MGKDKDNDEIELVPNVARPFIIVFGKKKYKIKPHDLLKIDSTDMPQNLMDLPGQFGWIASLRALANERMESAQTTYKRWWAIEYKRIVENDINPKRPTEKAVDADIRSSEFYQTHKDNLAKTTLNFNKLDGLLQALRHKKDMLQTISSNNRNELNQQ